MRIRLIAFGIAKEILMARQMEFELHAGATIASLKHNLFERYPEFAKLRSLAFAVGENYQEDSYTLIENDEVVIIPPVSGG
jgi:molybdopterin converting factor small subunit